jgi:DnaK suppressor protein
MTKAELVKFKRVLESKQSELAQALQKRDGILIEKSPEALDEVQNASEREFAIRNLDRESNLLRGIRAALHRIDKGTYGICADCQEGISPKRLNALPFATYCIQCQQIADGHPEEGNVSSDKLLVYAF